MRPLIPLTLLLAFANPNQGWADASYHTVGWVNTVLPGGGELLLGNYGKAALEASLELGTFLQGYHLSRRSPITLDGVPEDLPQVSPGIVTSRRRGLNRGSENNKKIQQALFADWLQEFGLKFHMVNVFNTYRKAAGPGAAGIDEMPTKELFIAPFQWKNLSSSWVYPALAVTAGALVFDYQERIRAGDLNRLARFNNTSQGMYDFTYIAIFPIGSGAPEEMFYRGFLQNEFGDMTHSPALSILFSSTAYAFSHSADDRLSAGLTGLYLGLMANADKGNLSKAITYHFWADLFAGVYQMFLVRKQQNGKPPLFGLALKF